MRACEGCRRRKIKCDAATTNAWPCAACVRLKLQCVPPTVNYNRPHTQPGHVTGLEGVLDFDNSGSSGEEDYGQGSMVQNVYQLGSGPEMIGSSHTPYSGSMGATYTPSYSDHSDSHLQYDPVTSVPLGTSGPSYHSQTSFHLPGINSVQMPEKSNTWPQSHDEVSAANLSDVLGELKIDETGVGT